MTEQAEIPVALLPDEIVFLRNCLNQIVMSRGLSIAAVCLAMDAKLQQAAEAFEARRAQRGRKKPAQAPA